MRVAVTVFGLLILAAGLRWLQIFMFTDYRAHLRHIMVPLGVVAVALGVFMLAWSARGKLGRGRSGDLKNCANPARPRSRF